ncbi:hypothetical protein OH807_36540 [Kitasatospora sp. NBC_01560]|uniref:hypothetical protein n=1 Tax=Kitasatospora sp. NBC_01560 TaxID=2975965 RepID=UPI00386F44BD
MRIELRIGRLVLDGVAPGAAPALREALERELAALLTADPPSRDGDHRVRHAVTPAVAADPDPAAFGRAVARAVHRSLHPARGVRR